MGGYPAERVRHLDQHPARANLARAAGARCPVSHETMSAALANKHERIAQPRKLELTSPGTATGDSDAAELLRSAKEEISTLRTQVAALTSVLHAGVSIDLEEMLEAAPALTAPSALHVRHSEGAWKWDLVAA